MTPKNTGSTAHRTGTNRTGPGSRSSFHLWAALLAGGDGTRLQQITRRISGDSRPKQFCDLFGRGRLLSQTRERIRSLFPAERQVSVVTRAHERFYSREFANDAALLVQPSNLGTGVAIALAAIDILHRDPDAVLAFFPCD